MPIPRDIEAEIYFLTSEEGGRSTPVYDNYRPQFYYNDHDWDAMHIYPENDEVNPGDTVRVYLGFISPKEHLGKVYVGMDFIIREGSRVVGTGKVTRILDLEESATNG